MRDVEKKWIGRRQLLHLYFYERFKALVAGFDIRASPIPLIRVMNAHHDVATSRCPCNIRNDTRCNALQREIERLCGYPSLTPVSPNFQSGRV
jgi:hypothetical protein